MGDKKEKNLLELRKILIPDFQRDYAQGRNTVQSLEIRENFISDIRKALDGTGMRLDFVYGKNEDGYFVPYDGQQRLTTLFLVHLYLLKKLDQKENSNLWNNQIKLEYQTSWECSEFIKAISDKKNKLFFGEGDNLKLKHLESVPFINPYVLNDDGVKGMLRTLSTIDECLSDYKVDASIVEKLKRITFYVYDEMEGEGIQFYLKMNTRGLALTPFENFRSKYAAYLKEKGKNENEEVKISKALTNNYENFFYKKRGKKDKDDNSQIMKDISEKLMSLIKSYFSALYTISDNLKENKEIAEKGFTPFSYYSTVLDGLGIDTVMKPLIRFLNYLSTKEEESENNLTCKNKNENDFWFSENLKGVFDKPQGKSNELLFMIKYFELDEKFKYEKYSCYMRLMMNLEENGVTPGQNKVLFNLLFSTDLTEANLLNVLKEYKEQREKERKSVSVQIDEEIEKLEKIIEDDSWRKEIVEAEKTAFANGRIKFLYQEKFDDAFRRRLCNYYRYFDPKGVREEIDFDLVKARIKLSTDENGNPSIFWYEVFNTSQKQWKDIFDNYEQKRFKTLVNGILTSGSLDSIEEPENISIEQKALLAKEWFIKWMMSDKDLQRYRLKYYYFQKYNGRYYIPFDSGVNNFNEVFGSLFFSGRIRFDEKYYYRLIDDESGSKHFVFWSSSSMKIPFTFICEDETEVGFYLYFDSYRNILFHKDEEDLTYNDGENLDPVTKKRTLYEEPDKGIENGERFYTVSETIERLESLAKEKMQEKLVLR